jgi:hypothetical protein
VRPRKKSVYYISSTLILVFVGSLEMKATNQLFFG